MGQTERFLFYKCMTQMMKKKELEMLLEKVRPFAEPDPRLEQYPTPAVIAADIASICVLTSVIIASAACP